jgi:biofilm PGA synthesis lipoprotein PgaB
MKHLFILLTCLISIYAYGETAVKNNNNSKYIALCYHDVVDIKLNPDSPLLSGSVSRDRLIEQFNWIKQQNYQPVSWQQVLDAKAGMTPLPKKAILLTFDDGYVSFYNTVFPLLQLYGYPAVLSIVGNWLDPQENETVKYGKKSISRKQFLSWPQIRELDKSALVEIASHSFDSHYGIHANPFLNEEPAITTPKFNSDTAKYETLKEYRSRLNQDFTRSKKQMQAHHVTAPRIIVWPYGAHNQVSVNIAAKLGMTTAFSLGDGINKIHGSNSLVKRYLMEQEVTLSIFSSLLKGLHPTSLPNRVMHIDLDYVYDPDLNAMNHNMDVLISRVHSAGIDTVYLQAFADPDGDGTADSLYFQNRHLPVKADIFNRVSWQLKTRAGVKVYAWMPVLAFDLGPDYEYVTDSQLKTKNNNHYIRLSPFSEKSRNAIKEIYTDLGAYGKFNGILFHDDAFLTDFEDASFSAKKAYKSWGLEKTIEEIRNNPKSMEIWTQKKTQHLIDFTLELANESKHYLNNYGTPLKLARNIYALPVLDKRSKEWFSQDLSLFAKAYDHTAVMAMPYMESADDPEQWLKNIAEIALSSVPTGKLVFELQAVNWKDQTPISAEKIATHMKIIKDAGIENFGYYPDNFIENKPDLSILRPVFSNASTIRVK